MKKKINRSNGQESLFAHIAKCADYGCGMHFKGDIRNGAYVFSGYVKHSTKFCSSHIIEESTLLNIITSDLKSLVEKRVDLNMLYSQTVANKQSTNKSIKKEIRAIDKSLEKLNQQFNSLLELHTAQGLTTAQFKEKNISITQQQQKLASEKATLEMKINKKKNLDCDIQAFKNQVELFLNFNSAEPEVIKGFLQRLVNKIEVYKSGKIKISYNLAP